MAAYLEKTTVFRAFLGRESLANTMPAMQACMTTPTMLCTEMMTSATLQFSVGTRDP